MSNENLSLSHAPLGSAKGARATEGPGEAPRGTEHAPRASSQLGSSHLLSFDDLDFSNNITLNAQDKRPEDQLPTIKNRVHPLQERADEIYAKMRSSLARRERSPLLLVQEVIRNRWKPPQHTEELDEESRALNLETSELLQQQNGALDQNQLRNVTLFVWFIENLYEVADVIILPVSNH